MDGKDLLRRVQQLLNEDSSSGWLDEHTTYDFLYEAAIDLVDRTGCLKSSQDITTVADDDEYDLNPDFFRLYAKDRDNRFFITLYDDSDYYKLYWKDYEDILYDKNTTSVAIPSSFSIIDATRPSNATGTATSAGDDTGGKSLLTDSTASFSAAYVGGTVHNTTDASDGIVVEYSSATAIYTALFGGSDNEWDSSDAYIISLPSLYQIYIDPPPSTADYTITVPYIQKPAPVYSYYDSYKFPHQYNEALVRYAAFLYKYRDKEPDFGDALFKYYERAIGKSAYSMNRAQRPGNFKVNFKKRL